MGDNYFRIEWIIELLKEQEPEKIELIKQLEQSTIKGWIRQPYIYFVSAERANQEGSEWQFAYNIVLDHDTEGTIVLDILKDGRVGGIEFLNLIPK